MPRRELSPARTASPRQRELNVVGERAQLVEPRPEERDQALVRVAR